MTKAYIIIGSVAAIAFAYPLVMRFIAVKVQPLREAMFALGDDLLRSPSLNPRQKRFVESMLEDAYSPSFMVAAALLMPVLIVRLLVHARPMSPFEGLEGPLAERLNLFHGYYVVAAAAANPLFATILALEFLVLWFPLRLLGLFDGGRRPLDMRTEAGSLTCQLEAQLNPC